MNSTRNFEAKNKGHGINKEMTCDHPFKNQLMILHMILRLKRKVPESKRIGMGCQKTKARVIRKHIRLLVYEGFEATKLRSWYQGEPELGITEESQVMMVCGILRQKIKLNPSLKRNDTGTAKNWTRSFISTSGYEIM
jgi:hypothetical protein